MTDPAAPGHEGIVAAPATSLLPPELDFAALYARHHDGVRRTLVCLGVPEALADDALQEVFVIVHRRLDDPARYQSMKGWIYGIARRVAWRHHRTDARARRKLALVEPTRDKARRSPSSRGARRSTSCTVPRRPRSRSARSVRARRDRGAVRSGDRDDRRREAQHGVLAPAARPRPLRAGAAAPRRSHAPGGGARWNLIPHALPWLPSVTRPSALRAARRQPARDRGPTARARRCPRAAHEHGAAHDTDRRDARGRRDRGVARRRSRARHGRRA